MIKKLMQSVGQYKRDTILTPIFILFEVIMEVIIPLLMANLIDNGIRKSDMGHVVFMGVVLALSAIISLIFGAVAGRTAANASAGFAKNLRRRIFYKVQNYSFRNIDKFSTSSIVTRLTTDVTNVQNAFQMIIRMAVRSPFMLIFALIMAFSINAQLALVFLAVTPILGAGLFFTIKGAFPIFERSFKKYDKLNETVQENVRGIRVVKSFVREEKEISKFNKISGEVYSDLVKAEKLVQLSNPLMNFSMYTAMVLISWIGAQIIVNSGETALTTGQLMTFFTYVMQILMSLMMVSMTLIMITISRASAQRITELLDEEVDLHNCENPVSEVKDGSISFKNVNFSYAGSSDKLCLSDIDLEIASGETIGIIGGTGSSKSTLVQLIPRLYDVTEGRLEVGGRDVREYDIEALRDSVSMVLQKNVLFSGTIKDNLRWGNPNATDEEIERVCRLAQADEFIQGFPDKYDTEIEQGGANVSGGQKQRLCIARALLKKPKILILDDSTSAVDTRTDSLIRKAFREEIPNTTKLIIAQRISSVMDADRIIVMDDGAINGIGTHEELLAGNAIYQEVYYSQTKGDDDNG